MTADNYYKKRAVALTYDQLKDQAPKIKAHGDQEWADKIIAIAKANHIPIQEDRTLVELLSELEVNEMIPSELYEAVAEIFAFIYKLDKDFTDST
ncbi:EscU/YscU/HrcU family type III secretion system export apparatus switch protein [Tuberibacillus sp. Marseille-P3662]|uniref:EscU/YscU/HrcU family type III secretion system export apparatus switch protein n=1 Tax=Tuberibacillus sp. Marseille-P3662 TaxID=1965358 RepID=UPI000A1CCB7A|nr:EscU/YscU/HrcU family type III secretion system export apparatus switch protein [Tuberibacillus sp. Marseille-P3662]